MRFSLKTFLFLLGGLCPLVGLSAQGLDWPAILQHALNTAPQKAANDRQAENLRDQVSAADPLWKTKLGANLAYQGDLIETSSSGPTSPDSTPLTWNLSASIQPLDIVSIQASYDQKQSLRVSASISPFSTNNNRSSLSNQLSDAQVQIPEQVQAVVFTLRQNYNKWAALIRSVDIAALDRDIKKQLLGAMEIKLNKGFITVNDLDQSISDSLEAEKEYLNQTINLREARVQLLLSAGLALSSELSPPAELKGANLVKEGEGIINNKTQPLAKSTLELAIRKRDRAQAELTALPTWLSNLTISGGIQSAPSSSTWNAGISFNLSAADFSLNEERSRQRALAEAEANLLSVQSKTALELELALERLSAALALVKISQNQVQQASERLKAQEITFLAGGTSAISLEQYRLSYQRSQATLNSNLATLETLLFDWGLNP